MTFQFTTATSKSLRFWRITENRTICWWDSKVFQQHWCVLLFPLNDEGRQLREDVNKVLKELQWGWSLEELFTEIFLQIRFHPQINFETPHQLQEERKSVSAWKMAEFWLWSSKWKKDQSPSRRDSFRGWRERYFSQTAKSFYKRIRPGKSDRKGRYRLVSGKAVPLVKPCIHRRGCWGWRMPSVSIW